MNIKPICTRHSLGFLLCLLLLACPIAFLPFSQKAWAEPNGTTEAIQLDTGKISGLLVSRDPEIRVFKGIPYAAPPVGSLRWRPPQSVKPWQDVLQSTSFGPVCPQPEGRTRLTQTKFDKISEDCLYLNVWTTAKDNQALLPVMVWIHGGGNISGRRFLAVL